MCDFFSYPEQPLEPEDCWRNPIPRGEPDEEYDRYEEERRLGYDPRKIQ